MIGRGGFYYFLRKGNSKIYNSIVIYITFSNKMYRGMRCTYKRLLVEWRECESVALYGLNEVTRQREFVFGPFGVLCLQILIWERRLSFNRSGWKNKTHTICNCAHFLLVVFNSLHT